MNDVPNARTEIIAQFHSDTKHSVKSLRMRALVEPDPENRPFPYKSYGVLPSIPLPSASGRSPVDALRVLTSAPPGALARAIPDLTDIGRLCYFANGLLAPEKPGRPTRRPAACTGGLRHLELYIVCRDLTGLPAGVYHFDVGRNTLQNLRTGDFRGVLIEAAAGEPSMARAPAVIVCTSVPWCNAWRYGERAYRHVFWDGGTLLANVASLAAAWSLPHRIVLAFADEQVSELLGLVSAREFIVALVSIGSVQISPLRPGPRALPTLETLAAPASLAEAVLPRLRQVHDSSILRSWPEVASWRTRRGRASGGSSSSGTQPSRSFVPRSESVEAVIRARGSARSFGQAALTRQQLAVLLEVASAPPPTDYHLTAGLISMCLVIHAVDGLIPGIYTVHPGTGVQLLRHGLIRAEAAAGALFQELAADSAMNVYLLADMHAILEGWGNRGYRAAQLTCGYTAGRLYLSAYAMGLAATGLTFFDDRVLEMLRPASTDREMMFLLAIGCRP